MVAGGRRRGSEPLFDYTSQCSCAYDLKGLEKALSCCRNFFNVCDSEESSKILTVDDHEKNTNSQTQYNMRSILGLHANAAIHRLTAGVLPSVSLLVLAFFVPVPPPVSSLAPFLASSALVSMSPPALSLTLP